MSEDDEEDLSPSPKQKKETNVLLITNEGWAVTDTGAAVQALS